jgi:hypothetical protein
VKDCHARLSRIGDNDLIAAVTIDVRDNRALRIAVQSHDAHDLPAIERRVR